jgi:hypothetical protein
MHIVIPGGKLMLNLQRWRMSTDEPRHRHFGTPLSEWLKGRANELNADEVGFWQIIPEGRDFGLTGVDLDDFVRKSLWALFERGAVPLRHVRDSGHLWTWQRSYGISAQEMVEAIVEEWIGEGRPDPDLGGLWFGLRDALDLPYVHKS